MLHKRRTWCVSTIDSETELARWLTEHTMCGCSGFEIGGYLFLNDSTSADGAGEWAVLKQPAGAGQPYVQIESITFGWCSFDKGLAYIRDILAGKYDDSPFAHPVKPRLESPETHGRCHHCA